MTAVADVLADLRERLVNAEAGLIELAAASRGRLYTRHLQSKAEGVRLALSYLDENSPLTPSAPASGVCADRSTS